MAEKYPSQSLPDETTSSQDQSGPIQDKYGLVVDQIVPMGDQHVQVSDQSSQVAEQLQTLKHQVSALQLAQTTGAQSVYNIETQYNVSGGQTIQNIDYSDKTQQSTADMSKETATTFNLHECQEELRAYYLEETGKINLLPWIPAKSKEMENIFVDLELKRTEESKASEHMESSEDLVTLKTNKGLRVNRVLVTGDAGSGKSTTAGNLAYKWALNDPQSSFSKFALVFLIRMKHIEDSNSSLVDLIFQHILTEESSVSKEGLSTYIKENAKDILFVIDGMDEYITDALKNKSTEVTKLLHNKKMRNSCVILTSRPRNISDLGTYVSHYTQVKLEGFSVKNIHKYIGKYFRDDKKIVERLFRTLDVEPHILALASIPVLLLMICLLWEDQLITPKTKTQLYQETIRYLWRRYKARMSDDQALAEDLDNEEFDEELTALLHKLGKVALDNSNLVWNKSIFTEKEFGRDVCDLGYQVGILKREQARAGLDRKTSVAFLHATFQEFCAAFHLAYLLDTKQQKLDEFDGKLFSILGDYQLYYRQLLDFCCGIQPEVTTIFLQYYTERIIEIRTTPEINEPFRMHISLHVKYIFEGQLSYEQCSNLIPMFSSHGTQFDLTDDLIPSVLYMLELYKSSATQTGFLSTVKSLRVNTGCTPWLPTLLIHTNNLLQCTVYIGGSESVGDLNKMYKALSALPNIKKLLLFNFGRHAPFFHRFDATNLLIFLTEKKKGLTEFRLGRFQFDEKVMVRYLSSTSTSIVMLGLAGLPDARGKFATMNNVIDILPHLAHLNHLELAKFQIHKAVKHLRPIMSQLNTIGLRECCLREKHLKELFSFLSRAQKLKLMDLSKNVLSVASVQALIKSLKKLPALEELNLEETGLNDESACIIARFVKENPSINTLKLKYNPGIGREGTDALRGLPLKRFVENPLGGEYEDIDTL